MVSLSTSIPLCVRLPVCLPLSVYIYTCNMHIYIYIRILAVLVLGQLLLTCAEHIRYLDKPSTIIGREIGVSRNTSFKLEQCNTFYV